MPLDYSNQNLRGKSFTYKDLSNSDFSGADIRGANFQNAIMINANFQNAKCGISFLGQISLFFLIGITGFLTGCLSVIFGILMLLLSKPLFFQVFHEVLNYNYKSQYIIMHAFLVLLIFIFVIKFIRKKLYSSILLLLIIAIIFVVFATASLYYRKIENNLLIIFMVFSIGLSALSAVITSYITIPVAGFIAAVSSGVKINIISCVTGICLGVCAITLLGKNSATNNELVMVTIGSMFAFALLIFITVLAIKEDEQFHLLKRYGLILSSIKGTNFYYTNLKNANFCNTILRGCCFNKDTNIDNVCFKDARYIEYAIFTDTIMEKIKVRYLLNTGKCLDNNYSSLIMKGAYLDNFNLEGIDFSEADLSNASLKNTNLRNVKLIKSQCVGADFFAADFTGACIENWNIDKSTNLKDAHAEYVYLLSNQKGRRPISGIFMGNEFSVLFQKVVDSVDFIFDNGIDWKAFMLAFNSIKEKIKIESSFENTLSIQSIENKGDGVFVVRVNAPPNIDKEKIYENFTKYYDTQLKIIENTFLTKLEGKENEINIYRKQNTDLKHIIQSLAKQPPRDQYFISGDNIVNKEKSNATFIKNNIVSNDFFQKEIQALKNEIPNLPEAIEKDELEIHLSTLEKQFQLNNPSSTIINTCFETIGNIIQGAAGSAFFEIFQQFSKFF